MNCIHIKQMIPEQLFQSIYWFSDIDTRINIQKAFPHITFKSNKLSIDRRDISYNAIEVYDPFRTPRVFFNMPLINPELAILQSKSANFVIGCSCETQYHYTYILHDYRFEKEICNLCGNIHTKVWTTHQTDRSSSSGNGLNAQNFLGSSSHICQAN